MRAVYFRSSLAVHEFDTLMIFGPSCFSCRRNPDAIDIREQYSRAWYLEIKTATDN